MDILRPNRLADSIPMESVNRFDPDSIPIKNRLTDSTPMQSDRGADSIFGADCGSDCTPNRSVPDLFGTDSIPNRHRAARIPISLTPLDVDSVPNRSKPIGTELARYHSLRFGTESQRANRY